MKKIFTLGLLSLLAIPGVTFAAGKDLRYIVGLIVQYFQVAIYFIIALAVVTFVWNVYKYFFKVDTDKKEAGLYVLYSVVGFFVIISMWGLVNIVRNTFQLENNQPAWPFNVNGGGSSNSSSGAVFNPGSNAQSGTFNPGSNVQSGTFNPGSNAGETFQTQYDANGEPYLINSN